MDLIRYDLDYEKNIDRDPHGEWVKYKDVMNFFENIKLEYDKWYMNKDTVSIALMMERDHLRNQCDWATTQLRGK